MRVLYFLVLCTSCQFFSVDNNFSVKKLDTVINFNTVDTPPLFTECKSKTGNTKTNCFRETIHFKITENLKAHPIKVKNSISEIITVVLRINSKGKIGLQGVKASEKTKQEIPNLDSLIQISLNKIPVIYPATKRGIPVTTQYNLPIKIQLKN